MSGQPRSDLNYLSSVCSGSPSGSDSEANASEFGVVQGPDEQWHPALLYLTSVCDRTCVRDPGRAGRGRIPAAAPPQPVGPQGGAIGLKPRSHTELTLCAVDGRLERLQPQVDQVIPTCLSSPPVPSACSPPPGDSRLSSTTSMPTTARSGAQASRSLGLADHAVCRMSWQDFTIHFEDIYVCRFFDPPQWQECVAC